MPPPRLRRIAKMTISTRLRLRPLVEDESAPTAAPTMPIGMTSQFIQPSSGTNATRPSTRVTRPIATEKMFSMTRTWPLPHRAARCGGDRRSAC
ncbi:hypothetical protein WR25_01077 [Diploscapter pachys]|uniref:Uncharacterized protein n=1 Tax=Diploscapter pachys TaxID=2018661 RepID=A0A2A2KLK4_9BILA|nr:hypothetical protein WR25_01077 [Diploscapter pachys]